MAYPHEEDSGIYVVAVNSKIVAVNNRRAIVSFLEKREIAADASIFVHKLGAAIDVNLHQKLVESIAV
ncbi:MAG: hypothetical protein HY810_02955 [Candidatus Omnitrophica bacterium]|nr:hypothetical protein [Candidatus Omnitrophota bacterium]